MAVTFNLTGSKNYGLGSTNGSTSMTAGTQPTADKNAYLFQQTGGAPVVQNNGFGFGAVNTSTQSQAPVNQNNVWADTSSVFKPYSPTTNTPANNTPANNTPANNTPTNTNIGGNDFLSGYNAMTPDQQANFARLNPNLDVTTGLPKAPKLAPVNYNVDTPNTVNSNMMNQNANPGTLASSLSNKIQDLTSGNNANLSPTDQLLSQIFGLKQYSPEEQANLQNLSDINSTITASTLAERRQIKQLQEDGQLTKEQAAAFTSEAQRRADAHLADLATAQTGVSNTLGVQAAIRNNQLGSYQTLYDALKGSTTLSPGQSLVNSQGQMIGGAQGIAPQVTSLAQQLYQQSISTGNTMINPQTGQPDFGAYLQQASQLTGLPLPQGTMAPASYGQSGLATQGQTTPAGTYGSQGYGNVSAIPQGFQKYVIQTPVSDSMSNPVAFVQADKVPDALKDTMKSYAANAGIPYLDSDGTKAFYAAQQILNVVDAAKALSIRNLSKGTGGRISNTLTAWANDYLQFNPDLSNFAQLKDAASKATSALAGGQGSGFRMNMGIIEAATQNLPTAKDSQETALAKADALATQIINGMKPVFPGITAGNYGQLLNANTGETTQTSGNQVIQTSAGPVANSWFK